MMELLYPFQRPKQKPSAYSLVDVGRDTVKAAVVLAIPGHPDPQLVGFGLAPTGGHDITGGRLQADATLGPVNAALTQAEDSTEQFIGQKIVPDDVIFALPGRAVTGSLFSIRQPRPHPARPISIRELAALRARLDRLVRQGLASLPVEGGHWQALAVTDAGLFLDNRLVVGAKGLMGRNISMSVFGVAGHAGALRAMEVMANRLDLLVANVVAAPQALASLAPAPEAVILDIGYGSTDLCLIRDNGLVAAGSVPFGGHFFTAAVAQAHKFIAAKAEQLKLALSAGELAGGEAEFLNVHLETARTRWYQAVMDLLVQLSVKVDAQYEIFDRPLPRKLFLTGGGSLLPGLDKLLRSNPDPFDGAPEVAWPGAVPALQNLTDGLDYHRFLLTLSLAVGLPV